MGGSSVLSILSTNRLSIGLRLGLRGNVTCFLEAITLESGFVLHHVSGLNYNEEQ